MPSPSTKAGNGKNRRVKRRKLHTRDGDNCFWCHIRLTHRISTIDHVVPLGQGGSRGLSNCVIACLDCNQTRSAIIYTESELETFRQMMRQRLLERIEMQLSELHNALGRFLANEGVGLHLRVFGYRENVEFGGHCPTCACVDYSITIFYNEASEMTEERQYVIKEYVYDGNFTDLMKKLTD